MNQQRTSSSRKPLFPAKNAVGFALSLILTFAALFCGLSGALSFAAAMIVLMVLACLQIAVQLYFFMHFMESDGPAYHAIGLIFGVIFTFAIVAGSIWIMTFNAQVS